MCRKYRQVYAYLTIVATFLFHKLKYNLSISYHKLHHNFDIPLRILRLIVFPVTVSNMTLFKINHYLVPVLPRFWHSLFHQLSFALNILHILYLSTYFARKGHTTLINIINLLNKASSFPYLILTTLLQLSPYQLLRRY